MAVVAAMVLGSFAADSFAAENVAPTKSELEEMYNKAFRAFDGDKFSEALKQLDAIDARQPDLAASKNLRGVILMRQGNYDQAEAALQDAARIDPKFWNARFNMAEIPFLKKDWPEARNRFEQLLSSGESGLAKEGSQLVQYKILLTYLLEGKDSMVDSIQAKLELSPDTPAVDYVKAAVALKQKNQKEAKDWISVAEKNFPPQLNKLFAESLYEVGWLERSAGEARPSLPLMTAAERSEKTKATARAKFEQAQQTLRQRDLAAALKLADEADQADPNQAATINLRGEILMQQEQFDQAEAAFKKAARLDPKLREAQYNLAQIPFKKKDYAKARERFETLYQRTPGGDKNQAAELIKFKIYMTLLLEGKESRAHAMMGEFQFTGDTPALYYAQAAWEYKHNDLEKASDWTASARNIYSQSLNDIFTDSLYDAGWIQAPEVAAAPALEAGRFVASQPDSGSARTIEPSPIPDNVATATTLGEAAKAESFASSASLEPLASTGMELTTQRPGLASASESLTGGTSSQPTQMRFAVESPAVGASPAETVAAPSIPAGKAEHSAVTATTPLPKAVGKTPAKILTGFAPSSRTWLVGGLLLAGMLLLAGAFVSQGRRYRFTRASHFPNGSRIASRLANPRKPSVLSLEEGNASGNGFLGGPRQVSIRLTASKPLIERAALHLLQSHGASDGLVHSGGTVSQPPVSQNAETGGQTQPMAVPIHGAPAASVVAQATELSAPDTSEAPERVETRAVAERVVAPGIEAVTEPQIEVIDQDQPVAHQIPISVTEPPAVAEVAVVPSYSPKISDEPVSSPTTTSLIMPEQSEQLQPAEVPHTADAPRPLSAGDTPVQVIFSFEIVSVQLTPTFKLRTLKVRPSSRRVTLRLAASQHPQPQIYPQVGFEVAKIQPAESGLGTVRLIKSMPERQQLTQQPATALPSFDVKALRPISSSDGAAMIQLAPSEQGKAHVQVSADFQMAKVEFSTSFEMTGVILNSTSKQASVRLASPGPSAAEEAPVFDVANVRLTGSGDSEILELHAA